MTVATEHIVPSVPSDSTSKTLKTIMNALDATLTVRAGTTCSNTAVMKDVVLSAKAVTTAEGLIGIGIAKNTGII